MAKQYYLSDADRRLLRDMKAKLYGRGGSSRPVPTRRRVRSGGGGSTVVVLATATISAATIGTSDITPSIAADAGKLMKWDADNDKYVQDESITVDLYTLATTDIRASVGEPVALVCEKKEPGYLVLHPLDMRSLPGFVLGSDAEDDAQAPYHEGGDRDFKLGREDC